MRLTQGRGVLVTWLFLLVAGNAFAQYEVGIPVPNWTVPPYHGVSPSGGLSTMTDISPGIAFVAVQPCRVFDTRNANGPYGGPRLLANTTRNFDIDSGPCTGIPAGVDAYSMNFGAILPDGANSFVTIWPAGSAQPVVSSINPIQGGVVANAAIVPAGVGGAISVFPNTGLHLYGDINGYFSDALGNNQFEVRSGGGTAIFGENTGSGYGVWGISGTGFGVVAGGGAGGVWATTAGSGSGVYGQNTGTTNGAAGVFGAATGAAGNVFGVKGTTASASNSAAGVKGVSRYGDPLGDTGNCDECLSAGVRGVDAGGIPGNPPNVQSYGVLGVSKGSGVAGRLLDPADTTSPFATIAGGCLGCYEIYPAPWGVYAFGDLGASGVKPFIEPHAYDPSKSIRYIALEGPEAGTYFRGKSRFERGLAVIDVPEDFRLVTDAEDLSVQVTPIGEMASVAVLSIGLDRIVVKGSRNVEFFYTVNGIRRTFKDLRPISEGTGFMPSSADARIPRYLSEAQRKLLIQNGTYNADGTVNMETARRLRWDKEWEKRERPAPQPIPE